MVADSHLTRSSPISPPSSSDRSLHTSLTHLLPRTAELSFQLHLTLHIKMLFNILTVSTLVATAFAEADPAAFPAPYKLGKMSFNQALGLMVRQSQGYQPTQTQCGPGTDCPSSCGEDYVQCASNDGDLHCYEPSLGESCCSDGSGNACDEGYYCTDNSDGTWCCPNVHSQTHPVCQSRTDLETGNES